MSQNHFPVRYVIVTIGTYVRPSEYNNDLSTGTTNNVTVPICTNTILKQKIYEDKPYRITTDCTVILSLEIKKKTMHPPLDRPHPDCQEAIDSLRHCHATNSKLKFW